MQCSRFIYSAHALQAIIKRNLSTAEVEDVINNGEVIADYDTDKPYPSKLILHFVINRPIHVVAA